MTIDNYRSKIEAIRMDGVQRGLNVGFRLLDDFYQFKQGYPLQIYGYPYSGKSELMFEILLNLSVLHGKKHFLFTPETGDPDEVYGILIEKYIGKRLRNKSEHYAMTNAEFERAYYFIGQHFSVHGTKDFDSNEITLNAVYELANSLCGEYWNFDTITIDPWAEITMNLKHHNGREDLAISRAISEMREDGSRNKRTTIVVNHAQQTRVQFDKGTGKNWNPPATPQSMAGGQMWYKRGFTMINVYRPSADIHEGVFENEAWIIVQKIKPRGTGKTGTHRMFYDWKTQRYYELANGNPEFAEQSKLVYDASPPPKNQPEGIEDTFEQMELETKQEIPF